MSIASEITRLQNAKTALKTSINSKNDAQHQIDDETLDDYSDFVDAIQQGTPPPEKGLVFSEYDSDGYPHKVEFVGSWTEIPESYLFNFFTGTKLSSKITNLTIPEGVTKINGSAFFGCDNLTNLTLPSTLTTLNGTNIFYYVYADITIPASFTTWISNSQFYNYKGAKIIFEGQVPNIPNSCFAGATKVTLYDFSNCTSVPSLYSVGSLGHANGCVIRIPSALSDQTLGTGNGWESATNWSALTNIVWEVV